MTKENWILLAVVAVVIVGTILMIKFLPLWATFVSLLSFLFGGVAGWALKAKNVLKNLKLKGQEPVK